MIGGYYQPHFDPTATSSEWKSEKTGSKGNIFSSSWTALSMFQVIERCKLEGFPFFPGSTLTFDACGQCLDHSIHGNLKLVYS